jgi:hypothetical protein
MKHCLNNKTIVVTAFAVAILNLNKETIMKYVVFDGHRGEQIIIFPEIIQHSVMANDVHRSSFGSMKAISGGFIENGKCVGKSESLRMESRGDADTALISNLLDTSNSTVNTPLFTLTNSSTKFTVSKNKAKALRKRNK